MTPSEEQLRMQLFETEGKVKDILQRLADAKKVLEPFIAFAEACEHLPDHEAVARRPTQKMSGTKYINLEARDCKALLAWDREGEEGQ